MSERELGELNGKMDLVLQSITELKTSMSTNYVQKVQFEDLKERVVKIENAPHKWIATTVAVLSFLASATIGIIALVLK